MKKINPVYIAAILVIGAITYINSYYGKESLLFFGFAENKETEINLDHPVSVNRLFISPGQVVKKGDLLAEVAHVQTEMEVEENLYKIASFKEKERNWRFDKQADIAALESRKKYKIAEIEADIRQLQSKRKFNQSIVDELKSIPPNGESYAEDPISVRIRDLEQEKTLVVAPFDVEIERLKSEIAGSQSPYTKQIQRLQEETNYHKGKLEKLSIKAPSDGVIGNIHCKEAEYIPAFRTLITFYEPNPTLVNGFVHENLIIGVKVGDSFEVVSSKNENLTCEGIVTGLGSRIVEIPERLRKNPNIKTYGREVLIRIPAENELLQKEKVVLYAKE